jgi:hypothetical protein
MKALGMNVQCEICGGNPDACESAKAGSTDPRSLGYEARPGKRTL